MNKIFFLLLFFLMIFSSHISFSADPPRKPFVILKVNGKTYEPNSEIKVRPGEKILVQASLQGGRRDYCSNPEKYANVGRNTVIEQRGENGMSFNINNGQFRGVWTLTSENAQYKSDNAVKIELMEGTLNIKTEATVQVPASGFSKIYLKVSGETKWHYVRTTPAGRKEEDDTNTGESTFYLVISGEEGAWYNSANISAKGIENFSVRNDLDAIQKFYDEISQSLQKKDFSGVQMPINNLKQAISNLKSTIDREKEKDGSFTCEVSFVGLPTDLVMQHLRKLEIMSEKWKEMYLISQNNVAKINDILLKTQNTFSANVLKSIFANYINWGTSIPTGAYDMLTLYDPNNILGPVDLPRKFMDWWETANNDASILNNQVQTIKILSQLRKFYLERITKSTDERKQIHKILDEIRPAKEIDNSLKSYFSSLGWAKFRTKN